MIFFNTLRYWGDEGDDVDTAAPDTPDLETGSPQGDTDGYDNAGTWWRRGKIGVKRDAVLCACRSCHNTVMRSKVALNMSFDQILTRSNMWASIPIVNPWFRMVWDTAWTYNLYLATPLGHIERNLLFHTNYFEGPCWFLSVFPSLVAQGCVSKLGDPLDPTHQMFESIFKENSLSLLFEAHLYLPLPAYVPVNLWSLPTQICTDGSTYTVALTRSVPVQPMEHHSIFSFFLLSRRIHRSIHSSNPILQSHPFKYEPIKSICPVQSVCKLEYSIESLWSF